MFDTCFPLPLKSQSSLHLWIHWARVLQREELFVRIFDTMFWSTDVIFLNSLTCSYSVCDPTRAPPHFRGWSMGELDLHKFELYQKCSTTALNGDIQWRPWAPCFILSHYASSFIYKIQHSYTLVQRYFFFPYFFISLHYECNVSIIHIVNVGLRSSILVCSTVTAWIHFLCKLCFAVFLWFWWRTANLQLLFENQC